MQVVAFWLDFQQGVSASPARRHTGPGYSAVGMRKSALLGRLVRGEEVRRRPCPRHRSRMWCAWGLDEAVRPCPCDGTGWLPNDYDGPLPEARADEVPS
jgi:hypothetical protein